jgi:Zn-dependent peptidase ImmA (M78 family)
VTLSNRLKADDPSDRFSMAHEIGHKVFHGKVSEKLGDGQHHIVPDTKRWLEYHAQYFASCLLMPAPVISLLYAIYWKKEFKREKIGRLFVDKDYYNDPVFQRVVGPVARKMNVSLQAAYIRLKKMGYCSIRTRLSSNC